MLMAAEAARAAALRVEIARKYARRERQPVSLVALRIADLRRLFRARYGRTLPDDDAGREDARIMAHHLARLANPERRIAAWLELHAPWMAAADVATLITKVMTKPLRWRADKLAVRLNLFDAERHRLRITTIGAVDAGQVAIVDVRVEPGYSASMTAAIIV